jgi:transcriptional regulator with XRE-family HTH domain
MTKKTYRDAFVAAHVSNTVASQIASLRAERKWTQGELAEKSGMRQSRISALEDPNNENFEVKTLERLASAFDVALTVRFVPYSEIAIWASNITQDQLSVPDFEHDVLEPSAETVASPAHQIWANARSQQGGTLMTGGDLTQSGINVAATFGMLATKNNTVNNNVPTIDAITTVAAAAMTPILSQRQFFTQTPSICEQKAMMLS